MNTETKVAVEAVLNEINDRLNAGYTSSPEILNAIVRDLSNATIDTFTATIETALTNNYDSISRENQINKLGNMIMNNANEVFSKLEKANPDDSMSDYVEFGELYEDLRDISVDQFFKNYL